MKPVILLVEEDKDFREALVASLKASHYQVVCTTPEQVEEVFRKMLPDLVVLGLDFSKNESRKSARELPALADSFSVPLLMLVQNLPEQLSSSDKALMEKFNQVLVRPFSVAELPGKIEELLARRFYSGGRKILDPVTGLPGYEEFREQIGYLFSFARRYRRHFSLIMAQLENRAEIEAAGEEKRKRLLQEVAGKLRQSVRNLDLVMRYGPAEFAILLPMTGNSGLKTVVRRLEHSISRITVKFLDGKQLSARLIFGGAAYSPQRKSPNEIFILAQQHIHLKRQRWQQKKAAEKA